MNRLILTLLFLLSVTGTAMSQAVAPGYDIGRWRGFRDAAVTHTFDDNTSNQLAVAIPLYDQLGFKVTLFTTTGWSPNWAGLAVASANGHEVASHTVTHPYLNTLSREQQVEELANSHNAVASNIPGIGEQTLAYPYCVRGIDSLTTKYYIAARGCSGNIESSTPADMLDISSFVVGTEGATQTAADLIRRANDAADSGGWLVLLMHGVDNDGGWSPISSSALKVFAQYLDVSDAKFWVDTFGSVVRYIRERDAASVSEISADESAIVLNVNDTLDDIVYDVPISVRRELPDGWTGASATQSGEPVDSRVVEDESGRYVQFDVVPDAGEITITKELATRIDQDASETPEHGSLIRTYPNPARSSATLECLIERGGRVQVTVLDLLGRRIETLADEVRHPGPFEINWNASRYAPGAYLYRMETEADIKTGILVLTR